MLLMDIIRELTSQSAKLAPKVSYFFCQDTDHALNNATATLRSLVWLLLVQQPYLIQDLQWKHNRAGPSLFQGDGAFIALADVFKSLLYNPDLSPAYFIIDALDECEQGLAEPTKLITTSLALSDKVKWLVSSRPEVNLKNPSNSETQVELDSQSLEDPVNAYIEYKISTLKGKRGYDEKTLAEVSNEICQRAMNPFVW